MPLPVLPPVSDTPTTRSSCAPKLPSSSIFKPTLPLSKAGMNPKPPGPAKSGEHESRKSARAQLTLPSTGSPSSAPNERVILEE